MIREFAGNDIEGVQGLIASVPEAAAWSAGDLLLALRNNLSLRVAEEHGSICGVIIFRVMADEAEILNLAVASDLRHRGIGSLLLEEAIRVSKAARAQKIFLEVRESNEPAHCPRRVPSLSKAKLPAGVLVSSAKMSILFLLPVPPCLN